MKKTIFLLPMLAIVLNSCLFGSDDSSNTIKVKSNDNSDTIKLGSDPISIEENNSIPIRVNESEKYIAQGYNSCDKGNFVTFWEDTTYYNLDGQYLYTWTSNTCNSKEFNGNSSSVFGTWTPTGDFGDIPSTFTTSSHCYSYGEDDEDEYGDYTIKFSQNEFTVTHTLSDYCWAEDTKENNDNSSITVWTEGCNTIGFSYDGNVAYISLLSVDMSTGGGIMTFKFNGSSCTHELLGKPEMTASTCSQAWDNYQAAGDHDDFYYEEWIVNNDEANENFKNCVLSSGWDTDYFPDDVVVGF